MACDVELESRAREFARIYLGEESILSLAYRLDDELTVRIDDRALSPG
jgi:hypothetical protein